MDKIRVGVVGAGYFGQFHAEKYSKMEGVELVGVVDIDPPRVREIAKRFQTQSFLRHSDLFGKVQAVSIAAPTPFHHSITKDFFVYGIDVLLEKPISSTLEEADELIGLAEQKGLIFQVGHLERFNGALSAAEGMIQNPFFIDSQRLGPFPGRGDEVDVVLDLMVHDIDIVLNLVNSKVKELDAVGLPILTRHFDIANARIEFENGCRANLTASRISEDKIRKTRIFQPGGTVTIDYLSQKASSSERVTPSETQRHPEMVAKEIPVKKVDLLEAEILSFLQSVRDRRGPKVSGRDGKQALKVALQIVQKIEEHLKNKR
ncbi:MAG: Gfo/Idh/MocA family oxidoreductase [Thermodesulfobacteriota bacterium]|nr:Gfo/Idh/MocA family oxidoreductase [Thermodesulfobacteriota bacterium]